ncbi:Uncharacterized protein APZ42_004076, partial [Daphnia magna]
MSAKRNGIKPDLFANFMFIKSSNKVSLSSGYKKDRTHWSGQELQSIGKFEFSVIINDNHIINHHFNVMNNLNEQYILGLDFLSNNNVKINTRNRKICYDPFGVEHNFGSNTMPIYSIARIDKKVEQALNVSDKIRTKIEILLKNHEGLFADQESNLGLATRVKHQINIGHNDPINQRLRRTTESLKLVVKTKIEEMLSNKVILESHSSFAAAIVMVTKKDGEMRMCIDYRALNKIT